MKIKLVVEHEGQSQELLATRISMEDWPDFFKYAELWAWGFVMTSGRAIMKFLWETYAENKVKGKRRNGYREISALTVFGKVRATLPRPRKGKTIRPPRTSFMIEYLGAYLSAFFTYRQVSGLFRVFLGQNIGKWRTWSGTQRIVKRLRARKVSLSNLPHPAKNLVIQADGTGVKIRVRAQKDRGLETKLPVRRKTTSPRYRVVTKELKLGMVYTERTKNGKSRYALKNRFIYGALAGADEFSEAFAREVYRIYRPQLNETRGVVLGDGASWIENMKETFFPFARFQLDIWHINKRLKELFYGWEEPVSESIKLLYDGDKQGFFRVLKTSFRSIPNTSSKEKEGFYGYMLFLHKNWESIVGFRKEKGVLRKPSSQAVEKQMDLFVKRRFKGQGMHWSEEGLSNLLYMRALMINEGLAPWMNPCRKKLYSIGVRG